MSGNFDHKARTYERYARAQHHAVTWLTALLQPSADPSPVLELGAGTGLLTQQLVHYHPRVLATDNAPNMLAIGQQNVPQAQWQWLDAWQPPARSDGFARLYTANLLQWCPQPAQTLTHWRRLLRRAGKLYAVWPIAGTLQELYPLLPQQQPPVCWRTAEQWQAIFTQAQWRIEHFEIKQLRIPYPSALELLRSLHQTGATKPSRNKSYRQLRALLRRYPAAYPHPEGVYASWCFARVECSY